jgi:hypothetical protein
MKRSLIWTAATLAACSAGASFAQGYGNDPGYGYGNQYAQAHIVRCESTDSRQAFCRVDTRGGVQIERQLSRRNCVQGRNWTTNAEGINVTGGCRADFRVNPPPYADNGYGEGRGRDRDARYGNGVRQIVHCASNGSLRTYCGDGRSRYAITSNRDRSCVEGRTWGTDSRGTWISGNCSADFERLAYGRRQDGSNAMGYGQQLRCDARASGRNHCGDAFAHYTRVDDGNRYCVEGQTWGRDERGVWVSGNCNAVFDRLPFDGRDGSDEDDRYSGTSRLVHCQSTGYGRTYCGDSGGTYTLDSYNRYCVEGSTWGSNERGLWVSGQCNADFRRQYSGNDMHHYGDEVGQNTDDGATIFCRATENARTYCGERSRQDVMVDNRDPDCVQGVTIGRDSYGTWVGGNCNAQLRVEDGYSQR